MYFRIKKIVYNLFIKINNLKIKFYLYFFSTI